MLTEEKLNIYKRYNGDIDCWVRSSTKKEKSIINDNDWYTIDSFIQDLVLIKNGLTSKDFIDNMNDKLKENCNGQETVEEIRRLAEITNN